MAKKKAPKKPGPARSTRNLALARKQLTRDLEERCAEIAARRGVNLFEMLLDYAEGNAKALGYEGQRARFLKGGEVLMEDWITPEMRYHATREALSYVYPKLAAVAIADMTPKDEDTANKRPPTRQELLEVIKGDPFFQVQPEESKLIDVTPKKDVPDVSDPFREVSETD